MACRPIREPPKEDLLSPLIVANATGAQTLTTGNGTTNTIGSGRWELPSKGTLTNVSVVSVNQSQAPFKATFHVVLAGVPHGPIQEGWVRGETDYAEHLGVHWEGALALSIRRPNFIVFGIRNDTGADIEWFASWLVIQ